MGALHRGHLALITEARQRAGYAAVSIFVNPTQFGPEEDLARYPRDLDGDLAKCATAGADLVFAPDASEMYPPGDVTRVRVAGLSEPLCGAFRPGHFEGVATVVTKLFALMAPCTAIFGQKDYQQLKIVERLARDLLLDVNVVGVPTMRDHDGLALSSRNAYLSPSERERALSIPRGLARACQAFDGGERRVGALAAIISSEIAPRASSIDYVTLADPETLAPLPAGHEIATRALAALAVRIGPTRLIDNVVLGEQAVLYPGQERP